MRYAFNTFGCVFTAMTMGFAASGAVGQCNPADLFGPETRFAAGDGSVSVSLGDLDGDGDLDMAVANAVTDDASVLLGNGDGTFQTEQRFSAGDGPISVAIGVQ